MWTYYLACQLPTHFSNNVLYSQIMKMGKFHVPLFIPASLRPAECWMLYKRSATDGQSKRAHDLLSHSQEVYKGNKIKLCTFHPPYISNHHPSGYMYSSYYIHQRTRWQFDKHKSDLFLTYWIDLIWQTGESQFPPVFINWWYEISRTKMTLISIHCQVRKTWQYY